MKKLLSAVVILALSMFCGCNTLVPVQTMLFLDDNGNVIQVDYSRAMKDYVTTYKSPLNGAELTFGTKLHVCVHMPDGYRFKAWETKKIISNATMYMSTDERWLFHARGTTCSVYERTIDKRDYKLVYEGVMCSAKKPGEL